MKEKVEKVENVYQIMAKENVKNDVDEMKELLLGKIKEKYVSNLDSLIATYNNKLKKDKPKEVVLLNSLKPFIDSKHYQSIDAAIKLYSFFGIMTDVKKDINANLDEETNKGMVELIMAMSVLKKIV